MGTLIVEDRSGAVKSLKAEAPKTLMEIMRDGGVEDIQALCGGACACATCHVVVADEFFDRLDPVQAVENELLDAGVFRAATSRLSCQIKFRDDLDGIRVTVAPEPSRGAELRERKSARRELRNAPQWRAWQAISSLPGRGGWEGRASGLPLSPAFIAFHHQGG